MTFFGQTAWVGAQLRSALRVAEGGGGEQWCTRMQVRGVHFPDNEFRHDVSGLFRGVSSE
jgi:hypothetical protein